MTNPACGQYQRLWVFRYLRLTAGSLILAALLVLAVGPSQARATDDGSGPAIAEIGSVTFGDGSAPTIGFSISDQTVNNTPITVRLVAIRKFVTDTRAVVKLEYAGKTTEITIVPATTPNPLPPGYSKSAQTVLEVTANKPLAGQAAETAKVTVTRHRNMIALETRSMSVKVNHPAPPAVPASVGGAVEVSVGGAEARVDSSDGTTTALAGYAAAAAAAVLALAGGGWHLMRRRQRKG